MGKGKQFGLFSTAFSLPQMPWKVGGGRGCPQLGLYSALYIKLLKAQLLSAAPLLSRPAAGAEQCQLLLLGPEC